MKFPEDFVQQCEAAFPKLEKTAADLRNGDVSAENTSYYFSRLFDNETPRFTHQEVEQALRGENREELMAKVERAKTLEALQLRLNGIMDDHYKNAPPKGKGSGIV